MINTREYASVGQANPVVSGDISLDGDTLAPGADHDVPPSFSRESSDATEGTSLEEGLELDEWNNGNGYLPGTSGIPTLTSDPGGKLTLRVHASNHLQALEQCLAQTNGNTPGPMDIYVEVLHRIARAAPLALAFSQQLRVSPPLTLGDLRYDMVLRASLDRQVSPEIVSRLAASLGEDAVVVRRQLVQLSLNSLLLPPEVAMDAGNCPVDELASLLEHSTFLEMLAEHVTAYQSHFRRIKSEGDRAQSRMVEANLRLVVSAAKKYLNRVQVI